VIDSSLGFFYLVARVSLFSLELKVKDFVPQIVVVEKHTQRDT